VEFAALFGSRARGDAHDQSDADVVVELRDRGDRRALAARLSHRLGLPVQIVTLGDAGANPLVLTEILRDGRVLVDRAGVWPRLQAERANVERAAVRARRRLDREFAEVFG
jgi:predicted nucleotidyltransferase